MFHYLFTNDLRISKLEQSMADASNHFIKETVPSASESKAENNNINTLGFYFNLTRDSNCAKECVNGNVRRVVLNFIKKFQFPNPRTAESMRDAINDNICIAPLRVIVQALFVMHLVDMNTAYLTNNEILKYIMFDENVAKREKINVPELVQTIINSRESDNNASLPAEEDLNAIGCYWNQCNRQIREMVKVLLWSGCIKEENGKIYFSPDSLTREEEADLLEILSYSASWKPDLSKGFNDQKMSYQQYMDIKSSDISDGYIAEDVNEFADIDEHDVYGIHIKEKNDALSDENPHICIGWSSMGNLCDVKSRDQLSELYSKFYEESNQSKSQNVGQIWKFIDEMKNGDYVIYSKDNCFHIGRITSDYYYDKRNSGDQDVDYVNNRKVKWLKKEINREILSDAMNASLGVPRTVWNLNDYKSVVVGLLRDTYKKDEDISEDNDIPETVIIDDEELERKYWILSVNPQKNDDWKFIDHKINEEVLFEAGEANKTRFAEVKKGDTFLGYEAQHGICVVGEVTQVFDGKKIKIKNNAVYSIAITCDELSNTESTKGIGAVGAGFIRRIYNIKKEEYETIVGMLDDRNVIETNYKRNRIVFGAPGTGKSFKLQDDAEKCKVKYKGEYERVTFHPDYTYSQFVGAYKPISINGQIDYKFVPGPFMRVYLDALYYRGIPHILLIEEVNRARVAAVFGDVFQLLDRGGDGVSTYPIQTSEDVRNYLTEKLGGNAEDYKEIRLPNNMFIWATMNSADQGVFPMDTAFKRRWNFEYININDAEENLPVCEITIGAEKYRWNDLRRGINNSLLSNGINEDKLLGPFFLSEETLKNAENDSTAFNELFKSKVIMYLFEDVMRMRPGKLFKKFNDMELIYSDICTCYDKCGIEIFTEETVKEIKRLKSKRNTSTVANQAVTQPTISVTANQAGTQSAASSTTNGVVQQPVSDATDNQGVTTN